MVCPVLSSGDVGAKQTKRNPHTDEAYAIVEHGKTHSKQNKWIKIQAMLADGEYCKKKIM